MPVLPANLDATVGQPVLVSASMQRPDDLNWDGFAASVCAAVAGCKQARMAGCAGMESSRFR